MNARLAAPCSLLTLTLGALPAQSDAETAWPGFHGPHGRGVAEGFETATEWDVESGKNIAWQTAIPGLSHSSPVIWGDMVFVNTSIRQGDKEGEEELKVGLYGDIRPVEDDSEFDFQLLCVDRKSGEVRWSKSVWRGKPAIPRHPKGTHAASTPATDGEHVATFLGSEGLHVYTVAGEKLWSKDFGVLDSCFFAMPKAQWGWASSPIIHDGRVYVQADAHEGSFVAAFDVATGKQVWRTDRAEKSTWCTPTVHIGEGRRQLVLNGWKHIGGYDLDSGKPLWWLAGKGDLPVPRPAVAHDMFFLTSSHGGTQILAVAANSKGELSMEADGKQMVWSSKRFGAYMQTPIVYGDELYVCRDNGVITCWDARTGTQHYRERLTAGFGYTSSGVAADGKLYYSSEEGDVHVVKAGPEFELLGVHEFGETVMATPAISRGMLLYRTRTKLVAIAPESD